MTQRILALLVIGALLTMAGCYHPPQPKGYYGDTKTMSEVVRDINANNTGIPTIWTSHKFRALIHDEKKNENSVDGHGVLLFRKMHDKPDELLLTGEAIYGKAFEIGSSSGPNAQYWVAVLPPNKTGTEWWGYYKNLGKPCVQSVPIHPDLIAEVLGVNDIDENFMRPPVPTMRFNNDRDAYMFTFNVPAGSQWVTQKEVWYDRVTKLPILVLLFDANGRVLLRANLLDHQALEGAGGRKIATHYKMFFPETKDQFEFTLLDPALTGTDRTRRPIPREGTIQRRPVGDAREIRIDEDCGD